MNPTFSVSPALSLSFSPDVIASFCQRNGIRWMALFGSVLREDFDADSDIDVLVQFHPHVQVGLLALSRMTRELSALWMRPVDLLTPEFLSPYFRQQTLANAQVIYEEVQ
jgi:hypothetical protein